MNGGTQIKKGLIYIAGVFVVVIGILLLLQPMFSVAMVPFSSGSGIPSDPYMIADCGELESIDDDPQYLYADFELSGNIDCSAVSSFDPIGTTTPDLLPFMGRFDGNGYTISNVNLDLASSTNVGIFARTLGASIRDVNLNNITLDSGGSSGALIGIGYQSSVAGVSLSSSTITFYGDTVGNAGGVIGRFLNGYLYGVTATTTSITVEGSRQGADFSGIGGLVGNMLHVTVDRSSSDVTVFADYNGVGGLVGTMQKGSVIKNSFSNSEVTGYGNVGGIVGGYSTYLGNDYYIDRVYFNGSTTATSTTGRVGGIIGFEDTGSASRITISNSFVTGSVSSTTNSAAIAGFYVAPARMINNVYYPTGTSQTRCNATATVYASGECTTDNTSTYYNSSSNAPMTSWDFVDAWDEVTGLRPQLQVFPYTAPTSSVLIGSCSALAGAVRGDPDGWYELSGNIDCAGDSSLLPLNGNAASSSAFVGILDGQGYTISGITASRTAASQYIGGFGLFTRLYSASISDVVLSGGGITALSNELEGVGGLAGRGHGLIIDRVTSTVPVDVGDFYGGGLLGTASGYFSNVSVNADIDYSYPTNDNPLYIGGILGYSEASTVASSSYSGSIRAYSGVGGIIGYSTFSIVDNVTSTGTLSATINAGGITGAMYDDTDVQGSVSYATSTMTLSSNPAESTAVYITGGLIGLARNVAISTSTFAGTIDLATSTDISQIGGLVGSIQTTFGVTSTVNNVLVDASITSTGNNASSPYITSVGGMFGTQGYVEVNGALASTTIQFGSEPAANYITSFSEIGGFAGEAWSTQQMRNVETRGSITIYEDITSSNGYGYGLGGFYGGGCCGLIENATSSVDIFIKSYQPGNIGGLIGDSDDLILNNVNVLGDIDVDAADSPYEIGGFVGRASELTIATSSAQGDVTLTNTLAPYYIGGFAGYVSDRSDIGVTFTDNTVTVAMGTDNSSTGYSIGGFAGEISGGGTGNTFTDTYASTTVDITSATVGSDSATDIGGYVGNISSSNNSITNAYSSGALNLTGAASAPFVRVGGFIGNSQNDTNTYSDNFTVTAIPAIASSTNVGAFIGSYNGGETFSGNAYDTTVTQRSLCSGIDGADPAWCSIENVGGADPTYFYSESNAPQSAWNFAGIWLERIMDYPIFGVTGGGGGGSTPPTVSTSATVTSITQTGAILNGSITDLGSGAVTARGFSYGVTPLYGATTTENNAGFTTGVFNATVSGLICNTTYYYRAYASGADGLGSGAGQTFTTSACSVSSSTPSSSASSGTRTDRFDNPTSTPVIATTTPSPTPTPAPVLNPIPTPAPTPVVPVVEPEPIPTCEAVSPFTRVRTSVDLNTDVELILPRNSVRSPKPETEGTVNYGVDITITPLEEKERRKNTEKFSSLLKKIYEQSGALPPGLVKKVGSVEYSPRITNRLTVNEETQIGSQLLTDQNVYEPTATVTVRGEEPCLVDEELAPLVTSEPTPVTPAIENTENDDETGAEDSLVGENILATLPDRNIDAIQPLFEPFSVGFTDEFGNSVIELNEPAVIEIRNPAILGAEDTIYVAVLDADGVTWFEVPFRVEGDTLIIEISQPGEYFAWLLPKKAIAAEEELVLEEAEPFALVTIPGWLGRVLSVIGLGSGAILVGTRIAGVPFTFVNGRRVFGQAFRNIFGLLTFRKKRRPWGTVYDSTTKAPVDPAYVELFDMTGEKKAEAITDLDGRYGFLVDDGEYTMQVRKTNYTFPSKMQLLTRNDVIYTNIYRGGPVTIDDTVAHDIPMDPKVFDWNQYEKIRTKQTVFFSRIDPYIVRLMDLLFFVGFFAMVWQFFTAISVLTGALLFFYTILLIGRLFGGKPQLYGMITKQGVPLAYAVVHIKKEDVTVTEKVTDAHGRYIVIVKPGTYTISIEERVAEGQYRPVFEKTIKAKNGTLSRRIALK